MINKKLVPLALAGCLIITGIPGTALAAEGVFTSSVASVDIPATGEVVVTNTKENSPENLQRIIEIVKGKINVPSKLSEFDYSYDSYSSTGEAVWNLNWYAEDGTSNMAVRCDTQGNILSYSYYQEKSGNYVPKYMKADLKKTAENFIKKVAPDISDKVEYIGVNSYNGTYSYEYQRVENGIPMPDNKVTVNVNYETGVVRSCYIDWLYNVKIPSAEVKLTKDQAAKKLGKALNLKLTYQVAYTSDNNEKEKVKAYLVYVPEKSYAAVDAKTGEVYTTQNEWVNTSTKDAEAKESGSTYGGKELTQEEIKKISEMEGLISKDAAIKAVTGNEKLLLFDSMKSIDASLYEQKNSNDKKSTYIWDVTISDPREDGDGYAHAYVDAKTGKILYYSVGYFGDQEKKSKKKKYSKEEGQKIFEAFLNDQIPDKFKNTKLTENEDIYRIADDPELSDSYDYYYSRVNEGVEFPNNQIYGTVDRVTGKISHFSYFWTDNITFESPKNIISVEDATNLYLSNEGYRLIYEVNSVHSYTESSDSPYSVDNEVRLVYRADIYPANISPFTGKQLDVDGEEYVAPSKLYQYKDLSDTTSERNIRLLAEIGIGFTGGEFKPNVPITTKELTDFIDQAGIYYNSGKYKLADDDSTITRMDAAKFAVQILGFEGVATLKGIYAPDFKDKDQISSNDLGYVALAQGLNLVIANSDNEFRPKDKLTRAEAADMIIAMLSIEK